MSGAWRDDVMSWGRVIAARHWVSRPASLKAAAAMVAAPDALPVLAHGCGRSYGDAPLNPDGRLIDCRGLDRFIAFDPATGLLTCEAGVRLADILAVVCRAGPDGGGWFLPVTPGTRFVTVGGAIASDVHGKNHHAFGTFGRHVNALELARSDGTQVTCSLTDEPELFAATIGGMGLTGLILQATIQLRRVPGLALDSEDIRFDGLDDFFALARDSDAEWEYTAAWVDCLASGRGLGRGIFSRARHMPGRTAEAAERDARMAFPVVPPRSLATPLSVRAFNAAYWRKLGPGRRQVRRVGSYEPVLYPLDAVGQWNRVYGPAGFFQFQGVVPVAASEAAMAEMLRTIADTGQGSMLAVMKMFADQPSPGLMSFPMPGATLTLDFPNKGEATRLLMARLEAITVAAGGRIYAAKDGLMAAPSFRQGYPNLDRFMASVDPQFSSSLARRIVLPPSR